MAGLGPDTEKLLAGQRGEETIIIIIIRYSPLHPIPDSLTHLTRKYSAIFWNEIITTTAKTQHDATHVVSETSDVKQVSSSHVQCTTTCCFRMAWPMLSLLSLKLNRSA